MPNVDDFYKKAREIVEKAGMTTDLGGCEAGSHFYSDKVVFYIEYSDQHGVKWLMAPNTEEGTPILTIRQISCFVLLHQKLFDLELKFIERAIQRYV